MPNTIFLMSTLTLEERLIFSHDSYAITALKTYLLGVGRFYFYVDTSWRVAGAFGVLYILVELADALWMSRYLYCLALKSMSKQRPG